jgi:hypothetical protein
MTATGRYIRKFNYFVKVLICCGRAGIFVSRREKKLPA